MFRVSSILDAFYGNDYAYVQKMKPEILEQASIRGKMLHQQVQDLFEHKKIPSPLTPFFVNLLRLMNGKKIEFVKAEGELINTVDNYIGHFDYLIKIDGVLTMCEFKTTASAKKNKGLSQVVAYARSWYINTGEGLPIQIHWVNSEKQETITLTKEAVQEHWEKRTSLEISRGIEMLKNVEQLEQELKELENVVN